MSYNILLSLGALILFYIGSRLFKRLINRFAQRKQANTKRVFYISKVFDVLFALAFLMVMAFVWSVDMKGVSLFASSIFAIIGVAMFAQWSILSNITASIIIFFTFPARVGDRIRILDADDSVEGVIQEITLFQVEIRQDAEGTILYPNNLLLQKPVIKLS